MKNKGYTLIELLGVMIILALLVSFVIPSVINSIKSSTEKKDNLVNDLIINAAEMYVGDYSNNFHETYGNTYCVSLNTLKENNYLKDSVEEKDVTVKISYINKFNYEVVDTNSCQDFIVDLMNLTPVVYDGDNWKIANPKEKWYDYSKQEWANAVILSDKSKKVGDTITVDGDNPDALAMFVWIPRYEYKIEGAYGKGGTSAASPGEIEVNFISRDKTEASKDYRVHPAFKFGDKELNGIWVGKFEISHETLSSSSTTNNLGCTTEYCESADGLRTLPNKSSLRYNDVSNLFYAIRSMERKGNIFGLDTIKANTHMIKNSEWGAVAYLSQSKYGKYGNSNYLPAQKYICQNQSENFITGIGGKSCSYNTDNCGLCSSTTGNIYGIYDMRGGSLDYIMAAYANSNGDLWSGESKNIYSGFKGKVGISGNDIDGVSFPDLKYYDLYKATSGTTIDIITACSFGICYGHALSETDGWNSNVVNFLSSQYPWMTRGGANNSGGTAGIFGTFVATGGATSNASTRVIVVSTS